MVAVLCVVGLLVSGCGKVEEDEGPPVEDEEWVPPIPGMKQGEENIYLNWQHIFGSGSSVAPGCELDQDQYFFKLMEERYGGRTPSYLSEG